MKIENKFDNVFRQKSRDIKIKPSQDVWNNIDSHLSRKKRNSVYFIVSMAACLLILVGFFGLYATQPGEYINPNYQVNQVDGEVNEAYDTALMEWVLISRKT